MVAWKALLAIPVVFFALGCSGKLAEGKTASVKGKVKLDGAPLANGKIVFDAGGAIPPREIDIKDGAYEGKAPLGKMTVRIYSFKTGAAPKGMSGPAYEKGVEENFLPARFNTASKFEHEVKESGQNEFDFEVQSK